MRAISTFSLEAGTSTFWWRARIALRIRVSISATGSVKFIVCFSSAARLLRPNSHSTEEPATTISPGLGYPKLATQIRPPKLVSPSLGCPTVVRFVRKGGRFTTHSLPRRLRNPRNLSAQRQAAETQAANPELAQIRARTSAQFAAVMTARGELQLRLLASCFIKLRLDLCVLHSFCSSQFTFSSQLPAQARSFPAFSSQLKLVHASAITDGRAFPDASATLALGRHSPPWSRW